MQTLPGQALTCRKAKPAFTQSASDASVISSPWWHWIAPPVQPGTSFPPPRIACYHAYAMASGEQLTYAPLFMVDMLVLRKRIETNKKEELDVVKFSNVRRINKKRRVILHFSAVLFLFA